MPPISTSGPLALGLAAALVLGAPQARAERGNPAMSFGGQTIDAMIAEFMAENDIPGMAVAIVQAPYIPRVTGFGVADRDRKLLVSPNTLFDVGPMAEAYTAVAVMQLVEAGRLGLDDAVGTHLPDLPEAWRPISVRTLLAHASGLPDYSVEPGFDPSAPHKAATLIESVAGKPLAFEPGHDVAASATDYLLLAQLVEKASGQSFQAFVRQNQFDRLGLAHTVFVDERDRVHAEAVERNGNRHKDFLADPVFVDPTEPATGYRAEGDALVPAAAVDATARPGSGGILASARDISLWDIGLAGGILVKDPALRAVLYAPAGLAGGRTAPVMGAWRFPGHKGLMYTRGDGQGQSAFLSRFTDPSELVCVTLLANRDGVDLTQLARRIAGAYDARLGPPAAPPTMRLQESPYPVRETIDRLEAVLRAGQVGVMARIDHAAGARAAGLDLPPTEQIVFGDPAAGTRLMQERPTAALDLPLRAMAWEENGRVWLGYTDPVAIAALHGVAEHGALAHAMRRKLDGAALKAVTPY
ncbi:serine hydrolase [Azospirillum sp. ST 5-10]|uniref:serine hydrolase n=1 Tax=unclassified Azospirillum TaxID=2630922 RepID=UPI003F4A1CB8